MNSISIIVPCYNAEKFIIKNISLLIKKIDKLKVRNEVILINDGSTDNTYDKIKKIKKKSIKIINLKRNYGKSFAIRQGIKKAKLQHIILIDCDLPYFEKFNLLIKKLRAGYDFVTIDRRNKNSKVKNKNFSIYQFSRLLIGNMISKIINLSLDLEKKNLDTQAGLKGFKNFKNLKDINFVSKKFFLDLELISYFMKSKMSLFFISIKYEIRNESSIKFFSFNSFLIIYELIKVIKFLRTKT
jgi:glycosyltransferase involved in cell wall biosynthesis